MRNRAKDRGAAASATAAAAIALAVALTAAPNAARAEQDARNGSAGFDNLYPTTTIADYVFACMAANGDTREALEQCSCSIDVVASIIPYDDYVSAETVLRMRLTSGEKSTLFKTTAVAADTVDRLRRAQAEAEARCF